MFVLICSKLNLLCCLFLASILYNCSYKWAHRPIVGFLCMTISQSDMLVIFYRNSLWEQATISFSVVQWLHLTFAWKQFHRAEGSVKSFPCMFTIVFVILFFATVFYLQCANFYTEDRNQKNPPLTRSHKIIVWFRLIIRYLICSKVCKKMNYANIVSPKHKELKMN